MGIPHGKPLRREIRSENHTQPFQNGVIAIDGPHPGALSLELLWAERSGKGIQTKPRPSLYHSIQRQWSWMSQREPEGTRDVWQIANRSTWAWPKTLHICFTTSVWSIHFPGLSPCLERMSTPIFRCPGIWTALSERSYHWDHTRIWCASLYKGRERRPPGGWYKRPPLCCRFVPTHGDLSSLVESARVLKTWPASGSWCATWDGDHRDNNSLLGKKLLQKCAFPQGGKTAAQASAPERALDRGNAGGDRASPSPIRPPDLQQ